MDNPFRVVVTFPWVESMPMAEEQVAQDAVAPTVEEPVAQEAAAAAQEGDYFYVMTPPVGHGTASQKTLQ